VGQGPIVLTAMIEAWRLGAFAIAGAALAIGKFLMGFGSDCQETPWNIAYGTSPWLSRTGLLIFNSIFSVGFASIGIWYVHLTAGGLDWFYMLTHWSMTVETIFIVLLPVGTYLAQQAKPGEQQPGFVSFLNVMLHIQLPLSLVVTLLYWTLVLDFTNLCAMGAHSETCEELPSFMTIFVHGIDTVVLTVSFAMSRLPFELSSAGWLLVVYAAYVIFSVAHYLLNLGDGWALYSALDWNNPSMALMVIAGALVGFSLSSLLYRGLRMALSSLDRCANGCAIVTDSAVPLVVMP